MQSKQAPDGGGIGGGGKGPPDGRKPPPAPGATAASDGDTPPAQNRPSRDSSHQNDDDGSSSLLARLPPHSSVDASGGRLISGPVGPGAYHVAGPNSRPSETDGDTFDVTDGRRNSLTTATTGGAVVADEEVVFEGFVPEPTPEELHEERIRQEVEEMRRTAVTLDPSAVRTIDASDREEASADPSEAGEEGGCAKHLKSPLGAVGITVTILLAIALAVAFGGSGGGGSEVVDEPSQPACTIESVQETYDVARLIVSEITSLEDLDDPASPQARALEWLACEDQISSALIEARDPSTDALSEQPHGTALLGNAGETQLLRRYILATFYFATSADGPWSNPLNFLSGDRHECRWHANFTRTNIPFGAFDPNGLVCLNAIEGSPGARDNGVAGLVAGLAVIPLTSRFSPAYITLDDAEQPIGAMNLMIRVPNNLTGTLPSELGYLSDIQMLGLQQHEGLRGSIPSTVGNLSNLRMFGILFAGPELGATIPSSLFTIPSLFFINMLFNKGSWKFPSNVELTDESLLETMSFRSSGLSGTLPPYFSKLNKLEILDVSENSLEGGIPDSYGDMTSLEYLNLHGSNLNGTLPETLGRLANVDAMFLGGNNFHGPLPASLGDLSKLKLLDLSHNRLEGKMPASFSGLSGLEHISLQHNSDLYGSISVFESLKNLSSLSLYGNSFSSTIPEGLFPGVAGRTIIADLGHNNFTGGLPDVLTKYASNTTLLSIMRNNLDADVVEDAVCDETRVLFADCSSCTCCQSCCDEDSIDPNDPNCNYNLNFYDVVGTEYQCLSRGLPGRVCPLLDGDD